MGAWELETWKLDKDGNAVDLGAEDLDQIAEQVQHGFTSGEINDEDEEED